LRGNEWAKEPLKNRFVGQEFNTILRLNLRGIMPIESSIICFIGIGREEEGKRVIWILDFM
jgi:hypothetical protein